RAVGGPPMLRVDQRFERFAIRHSLDAELAVQPRGETVVQLVVRTEPLVLPRAVDVLPARRRRQPHAAGIELLDDAAQRTEGGMRVVGGELVAAAPDRERRMRATAGRDRARVVGERAHELLVGGGGRVQARAGLAELLPHEQPEAVAVRVELEQASELLGARHAVERVDRRPVPAADRDPLAVDDERVAVAQLDGPEADLERAPGELDVVETLRTGAVRPPELRLLDPHLLAAEPHDADAVLERDHGLLVGGWVVVQDDAPPDPLVHHARAEVPAVAHARLVHAHLARPPDLRLALRRGVHHDREHVLALVDRHVERREEPDVVRALLTVDEHGRLEVDALEADDARPGHAAPVDPAALRHPLREQAVALVIRARDDARAYEVVEHAAGHPGRQPVRRVPRLVGPDVPLPLATQAAAQLPVVPVEDGYHSSRFVSTTGESASRETRNVL